MLYQGQYNRISGPWPCQENLFSRFSRYVDSCCVGREQPASAPATRSSASFFRVIFLPLPCAEQELDLLGAFRPLVLLDGVRHIQSAQVGLLRGRQIPDEICVLLVYFGSPLCGFLEGKLSLEFRCIEQVIALSVEVRLDRPLLR